MSDSKQTPKGKAEQISIIEVEGRLIKVMNWHGYYVDIAAHRSPFFFNEIQNRRNQNKSNIIVVTGSPGEGKTYFAIRLGEIFDSHFDPNVQIVFTRPQLLHVIGEQSPLKRGQVIIIDEAHYGLGSRRWMESVQKDLMDALASVRSRGYIIIIVALHIQMLDVIVRKYVLSYMIHMEERGVGIVYRLYTPRFAKELYKTRRGTVKLQLPDYQKCKHTDCLTCNYVEELCHTTRAIYERRKKAFVDEASKQAEERARDREEIKTRLNYKKDVEPIILEAAKQKKLKRTKRGNITVASMQSLIEEELKRTIGIQMTKIFRDRFKDKYPKIVENMTY